MKRLTLIIGLFLVIGLIAGCAAPETETITMPSEDIEAEPEVDAELEETFVADDELDVGEVI